MKAGEWIRNNKLSAFLIALILLYLLKSFLSSFAGVRTLGTARVPSGSFDNAAIGAMPSAGFEVSKGLSMPVPDGDYAPQPEAVNRMVIEESNLSLLVKNVTDVRNRIVSFAQKSGGYMVTSQVSNPQDAPTATVVVRVPSSKLEETLEFLRSQAVKVVSENLSGQDVTDQYVDVEKRIALLEKTLAKFESILNDAREVSDITNLTHQIISIQSQIDSLKGQQEGLSKRAQLAKITIYLSTDEIALPYAPSETWRPNVIFKMAVRSLVGDLRGLGTKLIWIGVYAVIWLPLTVIGYLVYRFLARRPR